MQDLVERADALQGNISEGYQNSCTRTADDDLHPGGSFCDENNPCLAHAHRIHALHASRVSTSSIDGVRIAPVGPDTFNAAPSSYEQSLRPEASWEHMHVTPTSMHTVSAPAGDGCLHHRSGSNEGLESRRHTEGEWSADQTARSGAGYSNVVGSYSSDSNSGGGGCGRTCDMFRGNHSEGVVCGLPVVRPPLRRARSTPQMLIQPLCAPLSLLVLLHLQLHVWIQCSVFGCVAGPSRHCSEI